MAISKTRLKQAGALALTGGAAYLAHRFTEASLIEGTPHAATRAALSGANPAPGRQVRLVGGAVAFDARWAQGDPNYVRIFGREYRIGTTDAAFAAYRQVSRLVRNVDRLLRAVETSISREQLAAMQQGFVRNRVYDLRPLSPGQADLVVMGVNYALQVATGLAFLDHMYKAVGPALSPDVGPRDVPSLTCINFGSNFLNPMASHTNVGQRPTGMRWCVRAQGGWSYLAAFMTQSWLRAYPVIDPAQVNPVIESLAQWGREGTVSPGTAMSGPMPTLPRAMGALPAAAWVIMTIGIAATGVALGVAAIANAGARFVSALNGHNVEAAEAIAEQLEELTDCCANEENVQRQQACCTSAEQLAARLEALEPALGPFRWLGIAVVVGVGGYFAYRIGKVPRVRAALKRGAAKAKKALPGGKS